jgi:isoleucyl-tRNA synthetase
LRNYPDVSEVFERDGSDAMRWFLMSSPVLRGGNLVVTEEGIREGVRQVLLPLWNSWYFFSLYVNADGYEATRRTDSTNVLDRYLLAKTRDLIVDVQAHLDALDSTLAAESLRNFADVLTNWYVRRSRDRFWTGGETARDAFDTMFTVLETFCRVAAPLLPLITENIWQGLTGGRSVHLEDWPEANEFPSDPMLVATMDAVREITSASLALRKKTGLRVRLPLADLTVVSAHADALNDYSDILRDELNVKQVTLVSLTESSAADFGVTSRLSVNARTAGPRLGKDVQRIIQAAKGGDWSESNGVVTAGGVELVEGEYELTLETESDGESSRALGLVASGGFVLLDTSTTPELEAEGLARDLIRAVQDTRKSAGFDVSDRIRLDLIICDDEDARALALAGSVDIAGETLASDFTVHSSATTSDLAQLVGGLASEWVPGLTAAAPEHIGDIEPNQYANAGRIFVAVSRVNRVLDV